MHTLFIIFTLFNYIILYDFPDVDVIAGCNHDEGSNLAPKHSGNYTEQVFTEMVEKADNMFHGLDVQKVKDFYLKSVNKTDPKAIEWAFKQFYGDVFMKCPTYLFAKQLSQQSVHRNVYFYELTYQTTGNTCQGVCHGSELYYVFGRPVVNKGAKLDVDFSREVMTYWTNFAKTGFVLITDLLFLV
jgi:carboxylesterase type B